MEDSNASHPDACSSTAVETEAAAMVNNEDPTVEQPVEEEVMGRYEVEEEEEGCSRRSARIRTKKVGQ